MKIYCSDCGHPNSYASKKPNFCQNCGTKMGSSNDGPTPTSPAQSKETEGEEQHTIPSLSGLDVEIESGKIQGIKFGEALGTLSPEQAGDLSLNREADNPKKAKRMSKKAQEVANREVFENFREEAGTMRRSEPPE